MKFDVTTLHAKPQMAAQQKMVDDGSGEVEVGYPEQDAGPSWCSPGLCHRMSWRPGAVRCTSPGSSASPSLSHQVWRVENHELVPVEKRWLGHFYGGDCYLVLYTYYVGPRVSRIIYLWQVRPPRSPTHGVRDMETSPDWGGLCPQAWPHGSSNASSVAQEGKGAVVVAEPCAALPRAAMPVQTSWLLLPTTLSTWTRSSIMSPCRSASPWARSQPT